MQHKYDALFVKNCCSLLWADSRKTCIKERRDKMEVTSIKRRKPFIRQPC